MVGAVYCFLGFLVALLAARKSLGRSLVVVFASGYAYGLIRARFLDGLTHFGYDATVAGMYIGYFTRPAVYETTSRARAARAWLIPLVGWPCIVMAYSPFLFDTQPLPVQLLGLRPFLMYVPLLVVGAHLTRDDLDVLSPGVATLNILALGVAGIEFVFGVDSVIPHNAQTELIYMSHDIVANGEQYLRIPATFAHAHQYGGTMLISIPFAAHGLESGRRMRILCTAGLMAAVLGTFACGARLPVVLELIAVIYVLASLRVRPSTWFAFVAVCAIGASFVLTNERLQRFETLTDTSMVEDRIGGSVNAEFGDLIVQYPWGSGLARAWGTSVPYFMRQLALPQFGIENEYGRILIDTGIPGLAIIVGFFVWVSLQRDRSPAASITKMFSWPITVSTILCAMLGTGFFAAIPGSSMFMLLIGLRTMREVELTEKRGLNLIAKGALPAGRSVPLPLAARIRH